MAGTGTIRLTTTLEPRGPAAAVVLGDDQVASLGAALDAEPEVRAAFDRPAPSHRKEYVRWVTEAKRPETRARRVAGTVDKVLES